MTDLDFGIQIEPQFGFTYEGIKEIALEAERLDFESLWVSDHFFLTNENIGTNCLECYTTLTALARDTTTLRLGPMVVGQNYRNPALLANIAASLDHISGGRLCFGIGTGWKVVRGKYYTIEDALCYPHPVQKPHIPVWVGGTGYQTLKVSAKHADAINFAWSQPPEFFEEKLGVLRKHCERYGTDYHAIKKSAGLMVTMEESPEELEEELRDQRDNKDTPYRRYLSKQPPNIVDTPDVVAERVGEYVSLGFDHFILRFNYGQEIDKMRLFAEKVRDRI
jgi:alkanesulfonate monooxygenase SsuD/methylene tetrahydromethanopterin reductase-like flavin-dependent oxidoreductase (luciferase family)